MNFGSFVSQYDKKVVSFSVNFFSLCSIMSIRRHAYSSALFVSFLTELCSFLCQALNYRHVLLILSILVIVLCITCQHAIYTVGVWLQDTLENRPVPQPGLCEEFFMYIHVYNLTYLPSSVIRCGIFACGHLSFTTAQNALSVITSSLSEIAHATGIPTN